MFAAACGQVRSQPVPPAALHCEIRVITLLPYVWSFTHPPSIKYWNFPFELLKTSFGYMQARRVHACKRTVRVQGVALTLPAAAVRGSS